MSNIEDTNFGLEVGVGIVGKVVLAAVGFVGSIVIARIVGPSVYGTFYLLIAIVGVLDNPVMGFTNACKKRMTETGFPTGSALGAGILGVLGLATALLPITYLLSTQIASYVGVSDSWIYLYILFVSIVMFMATNRILTGMENFGMSVWTNALRAVIRVVLQVSLVLLGFGLLGMVVGMVVASLLVVPVVIYLIGCRPSLPTYKQLSNIWGFARFSIPNAFLGTALKRMDILLLGVFATTGAIGYYEVASRMTFPAVFISGVAATGLMGRVSSRHDRGRDYMTDINNTLSVVSVLAIPLFFGALAMGDVLIVTAYGQEFAGAGAFLIGLALYRVISTQGQTLRSTINGLNMPNYNLYISIMVLVVNIVLGVFLIVEIGAIGIVIATVIAGTVRYASSIAVIKSHDRSIRVLPPALIHQITSGVLMFMVLEGLLHVVAVEFWGSVILIVAGGGLFYFGVLFSISDFFRATLLTLGEEAIAETL